MVKRIHLTFFIFLFLNHLFPECNQKILTKNTTNINKIIKNIQKKASSAGKSNPNSAGVSIAYEILF